MICFFEKCLTHAEAEKKEKEGKRQQENEMGAAFVLVHPLPFACPGAEADVGAAWLERAISMRLRR